MESNTFGKLLTSNIMFSYSWGIPQPPNPLPPYTYIGGGGPMGGPGGLNERGDLMSVTPKWDMFSEMP